MIVILKLNWPYYDTLPLQKSGTLVNKFAIGCTFVVLGQNIGCFLGKLLNTLVREINILNGRNEITLS